MLSTKIIDGTGSKRAAKVDEDHALQVAVQPDRMASMSPHLLTAQKLYRSKMIDSTGSAALNVNGSVTPVSFKIESESDRILIIEHIVIVLEDEQMVMDSNEIRRFGSAATAPGLTNGLLLRAVQGGITTEFFADPVKNIGDFLPYSDEYNNFADAVSAGVDLLVVKFDLGHAVILPNGTTDYLEMVVQDNLTAMNGFTVMVRGAQELL